GTAVRRTSSANAPRPRTIRMRHHPICEICANLWFPKEGLQPQMGADYTDVWVDLFEPPPRAARIEVGTLSFTRICPDQGFWGCSACRRRRVGPGAIGKKESGSVQALSTGH